MRRGILVAVAIAIPVIAVLGTIGLGTVGVGAVGVGAAHPSADAAASTAGAPGSGPLDGKTFEGALGPIGKALDIEDSLVFADGLFLSTECEARCSYPASPYYVREEGNRLSFVSETRCPYKDATIIWRGTVEDGRLRGESTWIVKRWYWTVEKKFRFEGTLASGSS